MECFKIENLSFTYPKGEKKALKNINLTINAGEFVTICGKSGCGKTTLLRLLKPSVSPHGKTEGKISFFGKPVEETTPREQAEKIGFVMQNPDNQLVTDKVWHELAFGLESLGCSNGDIRARVSEMAAFFGIEDWFYNDVTRLSGGQKQILNLASVMVMQPSVLVLDEPTSQLDPIAAQEFLRTLEKINRELGVAVILSEHRLEEAFPISNRIIVMDKGEVVTTESPRLTGSLLKEKNHDMYLALPAPVRIHGAVKNQLECPVTVGEGRLWLEEFSKTNEINSALIPDDRWGFEEEKTVIEVKDCHFRYKREAPDVIKGLNLTVKKGELFALVGGNGTGKTTALTLISGINAPYRGRVFINGERLLKGGKALKKTISVLPQDPCSVFVKDTLYLDLTEMVTAENITEEQRDTAVKSVAMLCGVDRLLHRHPFDLSGGEQQKAALAKVLLKNPEILLLDEPTKGMDAHFKREFADIIQKLKKKGVTIVMVSHDIEFCGEYADRCGMLFDGSIVSIGTPREFFAGKSFYTTAANRMARASLPRAITVDDVILACNGRPTEVKKEKKDTSYKMEENKTEIYSKPVEGEEVAEKRGLKIQQLLAVLILLFAIPLTIYVGAKVFGGRRYYFTSLLIIAETFIPFAFLFERRRPRARELVVISVLCAIAVAGRTAFFMAPQFKPMIAIVIISGICFGGETGFLVGAISAFVSNFFFGQGPWTPWQMFALGLIGFLAGVIFSRGFIKKNKAIICGFGFFAATVIYGGIMNPASVIMVQNHITWEMIVTSMVAGLPFDLIHGLSTAIFLWLLSAPMAKKIERIKTKYGLIKNKEL